jgi:broad specificity phosphatase PhoE
MKPRKILLIRHGQSQGNIDRTAYIRMEDKDIPLTEVGVEQALACGELLNSKMDEDDVVDFRISTHLRTRQTYDQLKKNFFITKNSTETFDSRLKEHHWGNFKNEKEYHESFRIFSSDPMIGVNEFGGETTMEASDRVESFQKSLVKEFEKDDYTYDIAVLVTHGQAINMFLKAMYDLDYDSMFGMRYVKNCEIVELELEDDKYKLLTDMGW